MYPITVFTLSIFLILPLHAQDTIKTGSENEIYYEMKGGSLYKHNKNGQHKLISRELIFNGMQVFPDGSFSRLNEKPKKLINGQYLDINGLVYQNLDMLQAQQEVHRMALKHEFYRLINGEIVHFKIGQQEKIKREMKINQHIILYPTGIWTNQGGKKFRLREGQCMDHSGRIYQNLMELHLEVEKKYLNGKP